MIVKWKAETREEQVFEACGNARHMPNEIDGMQRITVGRNRGESEHGFTHRLIVQLADEEALARYRRPPLDPHRRCRACQTEFGGRVAEFLIRLQA